jgi:MFS family permease
MKTQTQEGTNILNITSVTQYYKTLKTLEGGILEWVSTTYILFLRSNGITIMQMNMVNMAFMLVNIIFDPVTGFIGDKIGQKKTYLLGLVFLGIGSLYYGFSTTFWGFVTAESISAIGTALMSEALESWLKIRVSLEEKHKTMADTSNYTKVFGIACSLGGNFLALKYGLWVPWFCASLTAAVALGIGVFFYDTQEKPKLEQKGQEIVTKEEFFFRESLSLIWYTGELRTTLFVVGLSTFCFQVFNMLWPIIFGEQYGNLALMGYLWIAAKVAQIMGNSVARQFPHAKTLGISICLAFCALPLVFAQQSLGALLAIFLVHEIGRGALNLPIHSYSNVFIPNRMASTVNSIRSASGRVGAFLGLLYWGYMSEHYEILVMWKISGVLLVLLAFWTILRGIHHRESVNIDTAEVVS